MEFIISEIQNTGGRLLQGGHVVAQLVEALHD